VSPSALPASPTRRTLLVGAGIALAEPVVASQPVMRVGPTRDIKTPGAAAQAAPPGTRIEVDAGEYRGDVAVWTRDDLLLRAVGGRVRLIADGAAAEGKGIWVVRSRRMRVADDQALSVRENAQHGGILLAEGFHQRVAVARSGDAGAQIILTVVVFGQVGTQHREFAHVVARMRVA